MAERVLQELGELRDLCVAHRDGLIDDPGEEALDRQERRLVDPRHHFGDRDQVPRRVAGVDALGAVTQMEVVAGGQPRALLEDRRHELLGGARVRRRLEDHGGTATMAGQDSGRLFDVGEMGFPSARGVGTSITATSNPAQWSGSEVGAEKTEASAAPSTASLTSST